MREQIGSEKTDTGKSIIKMMPPGLAGKIAAGEVIQRPASVVKELLDNAIDAGADSVRIVIENAGRTLIQVIDNGCGMGMEDLRPCFLQHATSKVRDISDLQKIRTLGFRGEAMASISSISRVEVKARRHEDDTGYLIEIDGGEEKKLEPVASEQGTSVIVRSLFYNVPARRQFLKTDATEFRHILKVVHNAALSCTDIEFELIADGSRIYKLPPADLDQRITGIFGKQYRSSLIAFKEETSYVTISGMLGDPKISKRSRGEQFIFVNGRPVQHRYLTHVVLSIYENFIGEREYPFFSLFLTLDPNQVDVNVHPAKLEIKFEDEQSIIQLTRSVVKKALHQYLLVPQVQSPSEKDSGGFNTSFQDLSGFEESRMTDEMTGQMQMPSRINFDSQKKDGLEIAGRLHADSGYENQTGKESENNASRQKDQGFWQLHNRYILTQTRTGLCVIDQYRAHMRIIYEKALSATEEALPGTQQLLFAQTMEFSATEFSLLKELLPIIQQMGFSVQMLSGNSAIINGVPADIDIGDEQTVLREMLLKYRELDQNIQLDARKKVAVAFSARTAIPHGRVLSGIEMETIIDQLFACQEPYADPLKKPTLIYLPMDEIMRRFK